VLAAAREGVHRAVSSPWSSRTASPGCAITWTISRPPSTMPTWSMPRRSIRPASSRSKGVDSDALVEGIKPAATAARIPSPAPMRLPLPWRTVRSRATWSSASARATSPSGLAGWPTRSSFEGRADECSRARQDVMTLPTVRGKLTADAPLAPLVWFKSGGNAQWLFEPKDVADLQASLSRFRSRHSGDGAGAGFQPDRPRWRRYPAWWCGWARRSPRSSGRHDTLAAVAGPAASWCHPPRVTMASRGWSSFARSPARSAASCG
jgi:hypothetical protein